MFGIVLLVTFIMPLIHTLFIAVVVVSYLCVVSEMLIGNLCL